MHHKHNMTYLNSELVVGSNLFPVYLTPRLDDSCHNTVISLDTLSQSEQSTRI